MVYSASDIDAETLNVSFAWVDDTGTLLGSNSTLTINNGRPVGSTITATITVTDNYGGSDTTSDTITILNTDPTVSNPASISASPSPITTGVLTCSASFTDYNDGSLTPTYAWTLADGTPLAAIGDTLTIDSIPPIQQMRSSVRHLQRTMMVHRFLPAHRLLSKIRHQPLIRLAFPHRQVLKPMSP